MPTISATIGACTDDASTSSPYRADRIVRPMKNNAPVLSFATRSGLRRWLQRQSRQRIAVTSPSLIRIAPTAHQATGESSAAAAAVRITAIDSLSTIGSRNSPANEHCWSRRAIQPSNASSVTATPQSMTGSAPLQPVASMLPATTIKTSRSRVIPFATVRTSICPGPRGTKIR